MLDGRLSTTTTPNRLHETWYEVRDDHNRRGVPGDFALDDAALRHWYWRDGNCSLRESGAPRVSSATHGFATLCVRHPQPEHDSTGYDDYAVEQEQVVGVSGRYIRLRDYDARTFLDTLRELDTLPVYDRKFPVPIENGDGI